MRKTNATLSALICVATMVWAGSAAALNPQPLPPGLAFDNHPGGQKYPTACNAEQT